MGLFQKKQSVDPKAAERLAEHVQVVRTVLERYAPGTHLTFGAPTRCPKCGDYGFVESVNKFDGVAFNHCFGCAADWVLSREALRIVAAEQPLAAKRPTTGSASAPGDEPAYPPPPALLAPSMPAEPAQARRAAPPPAIAERVAIAPTPARVSEPQHRRARPTVPVAPEPATPTVTPAATPNAMAAHPEPPAPSTAPAAPSRPSTEPHTDREHLPPRRGLPPPTTTDELSLTDRLADRARAALAAEAARSAPPADSPGPTKADGIATTLFGTVGTGPTGSAASSAPDVPSPAVTPFGNAAASTRGTETAAPSGAAGPHTEDAAGSIPGPVPGGIPADRQTSAPVDLTAATADDVLRVLIIEDNPFDLGVLEELIELIETPKIELLVAATRAEGEALARATEHDVVLLDLSLPDSAGMATLLEWQHAQVSAAPVIILSGDSDPETIKEARALGVAHFIQKDQLCELLEAEAAGGQRLVRLLRSTIKRAGATAQAV